MRVFEKPSVRARLVRGALGLLPRIFPADTEKLDATLAKREPVPPPLPKSLAAQCEVEEWTDDGQRAVTLRPKTGGSDWHIVYIHGGGYVLPASAFHWAMIGKLIEATGATVTLPFYALAPEQDHGKGTAFVRRVYDKVRAGHDGKLAVGGDSAGANFALSLSLRLKEEGAPPPDALILFSPWLDFTAADPAIRDVEPRDVMLSVDGLRHCGRMWAGETDPADPKMSPLFADLSGLPPMVIFQGDADLFVVDARTFADKVAAAGGEALYYEYGGGIHDFMIFTFTPEAKDCMTRTANFLKG